jgi:hypothetical protein
MDLQLIIYYVRACQGRIQPPPRRSLAWGSWSSRSASTLALELGPGLGVVCWGCPGAGVWEGEVPALCARGEEALARAPHPGVDSCRRALARAVGHKRWGG